MRACVCVSACLQNNSENLWTIFDEIFIKCRQWSKQQVILILVITNSITNCVQEYF